MNLSRYIPVAGTAGAAFALALVALCACGDISAPCAQDAALQPVLVKGATAVAPANPDVATAVAIDTALVHPLVQAACAAAVQK